MDPTIVNIALDPKFYVNRSDFKVLKLGKPIVTI